MPSEAAPRSRSAHWVYPLPDWVKRGAAVRCKLEFTVPMGVPPSTLTICVGSPGRVISIDDRNVRVYTGPRLGSAWWTGKGEPREPYDFMDHMRGDFDGLWERAP